MAQLNSLIVTGSSRFINQIHGTSYAGNACVASGSNSYAEGIQTAASGNYGSHAEGFQTTASGDDSHAEGSQTSASDSNSHAEGNNTRASGTNSHAEGNMTTASNNNSHAEGYKTRASGYQSHAEGEQTIASNYSSHAEGNLTTASGQYSHAEGYRTLSRKEYCHAEGGNTTSGGSTSYTGYCHAEGDQTQATGEDAHAEGYMTSASGTCSHAECNRTLSNGASSHAEGCFTVSNGGGSHAEGQYTTSSNKCSHASGHYNAVMTTGGDVSNTTGTAFVIGNGTAANALKNAFSVQFNGVVKAASTITASTTADYAEYFEWADENPQAEDRVGYFVTFDNGDKIRFATSEDDYILGVTSGEPFVLGNGDCDVWNGMVLRDEFRRIIYEPAPDYIEIKGGGRIPHLDKDGNPVYNGTRPKLNPNYDPSKPYVNRADRPEWCPVGMLGVLAVRDDGTCEVNSYATITDDAIATKYTGQNQNKYRVIKRNTENVVEIVFR